MGKWKLHYFIFPLFLPNESPNYPEGMTMISSINEMFVISDADWCQYDRYQLLAEYLYFRASNLLIDRRQNIG